MLLAAACVATHLPPPERPYPHLPSDKLLHTLGFAALGFAAIWRRAACGDRVSAKAAFAWWLFLAAYGLIDEATQPFVGRSFEWPDWFADCGGAALGVVGAVCWYRIRHRYGLLGEGAAS